LWTAGLKLISLVEMLSLIELTIGESAFQEAGLSKLAKGLLQNTSLQILNIDEYTTIGEIERIKRIGKKTHTKYTRLDLNTPLGCEILHEVNYATINVKKLL